MSMSRSPRPLHRSFRHLTDPCTVAILIALLAPLMAWARSESCEGDPVARREGSRPPAQHATPAVSRDCTCALPELPPATAPSALGSEIPGAESDGLKVFVDPRTGRILSQPTAEQLEALRILEVSAAARATAARPQPRSFRLSDGTLGVYLDGAFLSASHVHPPAPGERELVTICREQHPEPREPTAHPRRNAPVPAKGTAVQ